MCLPCHATSQTTAGFVRRRSPGNFEGPLASDRSPIGRANARTRSAGGLDDACNLHGRSLSGESLGCVQQDLFAGDCGPVVSVPLVALDNDRDSAGSFCFEGATITDLEDFSANGRWHSLVENVARHELSPSHYVGPLSNTQTPSLVKKDVSRGSSSDGRQPFP